MDEKAGLIYYSKLCYKNKFVAATDGNLSIRTNKNFVISTSANTCKGSIKAADLVKCSLDSSAGSSNKTRTPKNLSSEIKLHLYIYLKRKDINAVIHTHPKFAAAFSAAGLPLDKIVLPEVYLGMGKIPLAPFAVPSTEEVPESIAGLVDDHKAILLANHGLVTFGSSLKEAYYLTEKVEQFAEISFYARLLGGEVELTVEQIRKLDLLKQGKLNY